MPFLLVLAMICLWWNEDPDQGFQIKSALYNRSEKVVVHSSPRLELINEEDKGAVCDG
jgi:hypothetical protein